MVEQQLIQRRIAVATQVGLPEVRYGTMQLAVLVNRRVIHVDHHTVAGEHQPRELVVDAGRSALFALAHLRQISCARGRPFRRRNRRHCRRVRMEQRVHGLAFQFVGVDRRGRGRSLALRLR